MRYESSGRFETKLKNILRVTAFALSLCLFFAGTFSLANAIQIAKSNGEDQGSQLAEDTSDDITPGTFTLPTENAKADDDAPSAISSNRLQPNGSTDIRQENNSELESALQKSTEANTQSTSKEETTEKAKPKPQASRKTKKSEKKTKKSDERGNSSQKKKSSRPNKSSKKPQRSTASSSKTRTIHHTASRKTPVYKTVRHTARRAIKSTVNETTTVTYANCKTCGKGHSKNFSEKVLSHYKKSSCNACGKTHDHAYTETIDLG